MMAATKNSFFLSHSKNVKRYFIHFSSPNDHHRDPCWDLQGRITFLTNDPYVRKHKKKKGKERNLPLKLKLKSKKESYNKNEKKKKESYNKNEGKRKKVTIKMRRKRKKFTTKMRRKRKKVTITMRRKRTKVTLEGKNFSVLGSGTLLLLQIWNSFSVIFNLIYPQKKLHFTRSISAGNEQSLSFEKEKKKNGSRHSESGKMHLSFGVAEKRWKLIKLHSEAKVLNGKRIINK